MEVSWLLMIGIGHGVYLSAALFRLRSLSRAGVTHLLIALTAANLIVLEQALVGWGLSSRFRFVDGMTAWMPLLLGPGIWLFARSLHSSPSRREVWSHYALPALAFVLSVPVLVSIGLSGAGQLADWSGFYWSLLVAKLVSILGYCATTYRYLGIHRTLGSQRLNARLRAGLLIFFVLVALLFLVFSLESQRPNWIPVSSDILGALLLASLIYLLSLFTLLEWRQLNQQLAAMYESPPSAVSRPALLDQDTGLLLYEHIEHCVRAGGHYRQPALSVDDIAMACNVKPNHVSHVINSFAGTNVRAWLNSMRQAEAERLLLEDGGQTMLDIALAAGFNSKATFYRVFKADRGKSPKEWRASQFRNRDEETSEIGQIGVITQS